MKMNRGKIYHRVPRIASAASRPCRIARCRLNREEYAPFRHGRLRGCAAALSVAPGLVVFLLAALLFAPPAGAVSRATLLGPDLRPQHITVQALADGRLSYFDRDNTLQSRPIDQILQLRFQQPAAGAAPNPDGGTAEASSSCFVELADGQRLLGQWRGGADEGQAVRLEHATLGQTQIPLNDLRIVRFGGAVEFGEASTDDRLLLVNGDRLDGFVISVGGGEIAFQPAGAPADADPIKLPLDRVRALRLGNEPALSPAEHHVLHLADGSRVYGRELALSGDVVSLRIALPGQVGAQRRLAVDQVARLEFVTPGSRLVNLADLPRQVLADDQVFGRVVRPRAEGATLHLHAPVQLEITLPAGAARVAALAELDIDEGGRALGTPEWADFNLIVRDPTETLDTWHFDFDHQRAEVNVEVRQTRLILKLDPAGNGPIMDRLRLVDAVVLVTE